MIYLFNVQMIIVCPSKGSVIEHYTNQSSGCEESRDTKTQDQISRAYEICRQNFIRCLGLVRDAIINSVNCVC